MKKDNNEDNIFIDTEKWLDMKSFRKEKEKEAKQKKKQAKKKKVMEWFSRNFVNILVATPIVVGTVTALGNSTAKVVRAANARSAMNREQKTRDLYCYDRSAGHYWQLRRKLTNSDWVRIKERKSNGEALGDILADMKVLK